MRSLEFDYGRGELAPDTDPATIGPALSAVQQTFGSKRLALQFSQPLPDAVLAATAATLAEHPEVELYVYASALDASLRGLERFQHVEYLNVNIGHATTYEPIRQFRNLRTLIVQGGHAKSLSIEFISNLPRLERLWMNGVSRGQEALSQTSNLRHLSCGAQSKTLEALRGHAALEFLTLKFGSARDLTPLTAIPRLRGVEIYRISKLDATDLEPLGDCVGLEALSLGALPNLTDLAALRRSPSKSLRCLLLERISGLTSLEDGGECHMLEQLGLYESRPADRSLVPLTRLPRLEHVVIRDAYPQAEFEHFNSWFTGASLSYRKVQRGKPRPRWRTPVAELLNESD